MFATPNLISSSTCQNYVILCALLFENFESIDDGSEIFAGQVSLRQICVMVDWRWKPFLINVIVHGKGTMVCFLFNSEEVFTMSPSDKIANIPR